MYIFALCRNLSGTHFSLMLWTAYYQNNNSTWEPYVYDGIATGMEAIDNARKTTDDGTPQYNMQGQRVGNGYHGIVIRNGRKVLVK